MSSWNRIPLIGLDGSNLLAYLASLGTLRTLALENPDGVKMSWTDRGGAWRPVIHHPQLAGEADLADRLVALLDSTQPPNPAFTFANDLALEPEKFAEQATAAAQAATAADRTWADFMAAFGCEAFAEQGTIQHTAFCVMKGAGHQHFLGFMAELHRGTDREHFQRALFQPWDYADPPPAMRWDPHDFRPHALRATDPSKDAIRTVRGANRLAVEALPLFSTVPTRGGLGTVGFRHSTIEEITWPVWGPAISLGALRSLLSLPELQADRPARQELAARGVLQLYRARKFKEDRYRNFSHARELL